MKLLREGELEFVFGDDRAAFLLNFGVIPRTANARIPHSIAARGEG